MSRRIFLDVEEAIGREVRRITFHDSRTVDKVILRETYDPFTGEVISMPIEPNFYDSSADTRSIEYPHFFIRLLKSREDRFSGRVVPQDQKWLECPVIYSPKAYEIVAMGNDAVINSNGNVINTGILKISKVEPGHLLRILGGPNKGTYLVNTITKDSLGNHSIELSNTIVQDLPLYSFDSILRMVGFAVPVDLNTVKIGDIFTDSSSNTFNITAIDAISGKFVIDGVDEPDLLEGATISRSGDLLVADLNLVNFLVLDPNKPIKSAGFSQGKPSTNELFSAPIPIDAYYLIRIDSKTKQNHTDILNRIWEEFNPPRTALPTIVRSALSAEAILTEDVDSGGSNTVSVSAEDAQEFNIGDKVYIFDDLSPSKNSNGEGFQRPFESVVVGKPSTTELELQDVVPDTYLTRNCSKIVSNASFELFMFHFVDHVTKDVEGSQYWVHEFTFWVQFWVDRLGEGKLVQSITDVQTQLEENDTDDDDTNNIIYDPYN
jgi:hypothetical protein